MAVSYRRNRNYTNQFNWTYELNQELFECYKKAKSDPRIGYMNSMKVLWDNLHPEYASFSAKNQEIRQPSLIIIIIITLYFISVKKSKSKSIVLFHSNKASEDANIHLI